MKPSRSLLMLLALFVWLAPRQAHAQAEPDFDFVVTVSDGADSADLTLGLDPGASDAYVVGEDQEGPPALPPPGGFGAAIEIAGTGLFFTDIRASAPAPASFTFPLTYQPGENQGPIVLTWDPGVLPANVQATLTDKITGDLFTLDMKSTSSLDVSTGTGIGEDVVVTFVVLAPPAAPTGLGAAATSPTGVDLSWTDNASDEASYEVERSDDGGATFAPLATGLAADTEAYSDTGLAPGTEYCYRTRAVNGVGASAYSNVACATTDNVVLTFSPGSLSFSLEVGSGTDADGFTVEATPAPAGAITLAVDYASGSGWLTAPSSTTAGTAETLTVDATGLAAGTYTATVTASTAETGFDDGTLSVTLVVSSLPPPAAPTDLAAQVISATQIDLSWTDNASDEASYEVERSDDGGATFAPLATGLAADTEAYSDTGLAPGTEYCYRASAVNANGASSSSSVCATTSTVALAFAPASLAFTLPEGSGTDTGGFTVEATPAPAGAITLTVAYTDGSGWLAAPSTTTAGSAETLTVDASGLAEGSYAATVTASSTEAGYDDATLNVTLTVTGSSAGADFVASLQVEDANGISLTSPLQFGTAPDALSGIDTYDALAPPPAPSGAFDARWKNSQAGDLFTDIRPTVTTAAPIVWTVAFAPSTGGLPVTLSWNTGDFPANGRFVMASLDGTVNVDMRAVQSVDISAATIDQLTITYSLTSLFDLSMTGGWNLVALPLDVDDNTYQSVFADVSIEQAPFQFGGSYIQALLLEMGKGYWALLTNAGVQEIEGFSRPSITLNLTSGWNLIGGASCDVPLASVNDAGNIIDPTTLYAFSGSYVQSSVVNQGTGYWIFATGDGQVTLDCAGAKDESVNAATDEGELSRLIVRDAAKKTQTLYLDSSQPATSYRMPPVPPAGAFDVRFADDTRMFTGTEGMIRVQGAHYPLRVEVASLADGAGETYRLEEWKDGQMVHAHVLSSGAMVEVVDPTAELYVRSAVETGEVLPEAFALRGNYPNPLRTVTTLAFDLPEAAEVQIDVMDLLGRRVMTLPTQSKEAGVNQTLQLDATGLAAGTYLYRLTVRMANHTATQTGRMLVIK